MRGKNDTGRQKVEAGDVQSHYGGPELSMVHRWNGAYLPVSILQYMCA